MLKANELNTIKPNEAEEEKKIIILETKRKGKRAMTALKEELMVHIANPKESKRLYPFDEMMTVSEFQKSMLFENDDYDLRDVLGDYLDFDGELKFVDDEIAEN